MSTNTITGCYNTGTVSGIDRVGGVCGLNDKKHSPIATIPAQSAAPVKWAVCAERTKAHSQAAII